MSKFYLKKNTIATGKNGNVTDTSGKIIFSIAETNTLPTRKKYLIFAEKDVVIGEITTIRSNFGINNLPRYVLELNDGSQIKVIKELKQFTPEYKIEGADLSLEGDWLSDQFAICRFAEELALIRQKKQAEARFYEIEVIDKEAIYLVVGLMVTLTLIHEIEKN